MAPKTAKAPEEKRNDFKIDLPFSGGGQLTLKFTNDIPLLIFLREIVEALKKIELSGYVEKSLRLEIIQLLEEKFGLKVKVCGNCKYYVPSIYLARGKCFYHVPDGYPGETIDFSDVCERDWTPKEVEEKKEN